MLKEPIPYLQLIYKNFLSFNDKENLHIEATGVRNVFANFGRLNRNVGLRGDLACLVNKQRYSEIQTSYI